MLPAHGWVAVRPVPLPLSNATAYCKPSGMPFRSVDEMFMCSTYSARDWQSKPTFHILLFLLWSKASWTASPVRQTAGGSYSRI
jgi:hypothetical protein